MPEPPTKPSSQAEVLAWLAEHHPELHAAAELDRKWVWLVYPLRGCGRKRCDCAECAEKAALRESIKAAGFRFKFDGDHILPSGQTSRWGHNCGAPIPRGKRGERESPVGRVPPRGAPSSIDAMSDAELLAAIGCA